MPDQYGNPTLLDLLRAKAWADPLQNIPNTPLGVSPDKALQAIPNSPLGVSTDGAIQLLGSGGSRKSTYPTFNDLFSDPDVFKQLYNTQRLYSQAGMGNPFASPQDQPAFQAISRVPEPASKTAWDHLREAALIGAGGLSDAARIYQGAPTQNSAAQALSTQGLTDAQRAELTQRAQIANASQENQFGATALRNQALLQREMLRQQGMNTRLTTKSTQGKVRVLQEADAAGNPINVAYQETLDPTSGEMVLRRIGLQQGDQTKTSTGKPIHYTPVATEGGGVTRVPTTGASAAGQTVTGPGGQPLMKQPSDKQIGQVASDVTTLQGINEIWKSYQTLHKATGGDQPTLSSSTLGRIIGTEVGETKYGGKFAPQYNLYISTRRAALNRYIKAITGAQFSVQEMQRYESQFPQATDDEEVARQKLGILAQQAAADMSAYITAHGGLARMRQDPTEVWRFGSGPPPPAGQRIPSPPPSPAGTAKKSLDDIWNESR